MPNATFPVVAAECAFPHNPGNVQAAYVQQVLADLPVGYARMAAIGQGDLSEYGTAINYSGVSLSGVGPFASLDPGNGCILFPGSGTAQYVELANSFWINNLTAPLSVECWYFDSSVAAVQELFDNRGTAGHGFILRLESGLLKVYCWDTTIANWRTVNDPVATNDNQWHHAVATFDGVTLTLYRDGVPVGTPVTAASWSPPATATSFVIGSYRQTLTTEQLQGYVSEAAVYNRVLTAARVAAHYAGRLVPNVAVDVNSLPWCNITRDVISLGPANGREKEIDRIELGSMSARLRNNSRIYEPEYQGVVANTSRNPSFEVDASNWSTFVTAGTIALTRVQPASPASARDGQWAGQVVATPTTGTGILVYQAATADGVPIATVADTVLLRASFYYASGAQPTNVQLTARVLDSTGALLRQAAVQTVNTPTVGTWIDLQGTYTPVAGDAFVTVQVTVNGVTNSQTTFLVDRAQAALLANLPPELPYVTGDSEAGRWSGTRQASQSYYGSPYYPNVVPNRRIRVRAAWPLQLVPNGRFNRSGTLPAPWVAAVAGAATQAIATGQTPPTGLGANRPGGAETTINVWQATSPAGAGTDQASLLSDFIPVDARQTYTLAAWFNRSAAGSPASFIRVQCYDDEKDLLGEVPPARAAAGVSFPNSISGAFTIAGTNVWEKWGGTIGGDDGRHFQMRGFMPGTKYVKVVIFPLYNPQAAYTGTVSVTAVSLTPGAATFNPADYYVNNAPDILYDASDAWSEVWNGYVTSWTPSWPAPKRGEVEVPAADGFSILAGRPVSVIIPVTTSGGQAMFLLDAAGWPRSERAINNGSATVQLFSFATSPASITQHLGDVVYDTEAGVFFFNASGVAIFYDRTDRVASGAHATSLVTFGDGGPLSGELPFLAVTPFYTSELIYNKVVVTRNGGVAQTQEDTASQQSYGVKELDISSYHISDSDAQTFANVIVGRYKQPHLRFDAMTLEGRRDSRLWPHILKRQISERITVVRRPYGTASPLTSQVHIDKIAHEITVSGGQGRSWVATFGLTPADTQTYWIMDTSALDSTTRLSF